MALRARPEHRDQLENMALTWEQLADSRRKKLEFNGALAEDEAFED